MDIWKPPVVTMPIRCKVKIYSSMFRLLVTAVIESVIVVPLRFPRPGFRTKKVMALPLKSGIQQANSSNLSVWLKDGVINHSAGENPRGNMGGVAELAADFARTLFSGLVHIWSELFGKPLTT